MYQTKTPFRLIGQPSREALLQEFKGTSLNLLRTPAFVIDRHVFERNCERMHATARKWGAEFRAHLKTHKTAEGTRLQLQSNVTKTNAVVVSTAMEAWQVVQSGLVADGTVKDILYGLPIAINKIADLSALWDELQAHNAILRILVDHKDQISALEHFERSRNPPRRWSVFVKVDAGYKRAGVNPDSPHFRDFLDMVLKSPALSLYGFYCHAGNSYASTSQSDAASFLSSEVEATNKAAKIALELLAEKTHSAQYLPFVLSVGSTPTAQAASQATLAELNSLLHGKLELHAGNYPLLDLQQLSTGLTSRDRIAHSVLATVISTYFGRASDGTDEVMCDAGAIAMSKDTGPSGGFGEVIGKPWKLVKVSQEHGILTRTMHHDGPSEPMSQDLTVGEQIRIVGQHACLIAAAYPWYYIVDSGDDSSEDTVVDVWVPWKGW